MQKSYIIIDTDTKSQIDSSGYFVTKSSAFPLIERGQWQVLCIQFVRRDIDDLGTITLTDAAFDANASFVFVADNDFEDDNSLMLKSYQSVVPFDETDTQSNRFNIAGDWIDGGTADLTKGQMSIRINSDTAKFVEVLGNRKAVTSGLYVNIKQYMSGFSNPSSIAWFNFVAQNTVRDWGEPEELPPEGSVLTPFITSYLKNPFNFQFSIDGISDWHETQTAEDRYYRQRIANIDAEWSEAVMMIQGIQGEQGIQGIQGEQGIQGIQGIQGEQGIAATVAVGTVSTGLPGTEVIVTNVGTGNEAIFDFTIPRGSAFTIDATGLLSDRSNYDAEVKGFSYLATDDGNVYIKNSDTSGDWSDPIPFKGDKGDTGAVGPQGPEGEKGDAGYTPVRGTDYWTDADILSIHSYIDQQIGTVAEVLDDINGEVV